LAVPKSIDRSLEKTPLSFLNMATGNPKNLEVRKTG
jgi:hypothetical protein